MSILMQLGKLTMKKGETKTKTKQNETQKKRQNVDKVIGNKNGLSK